MPLFIDTAPAIHSSSTRASLPGHLLSVVHFVAAGRHLPSVHAATPIHVGVLPLVGDHLPDARTCRIPLKAASLLVQPTQCAQLFLASELGIANCGLQHANRFIINL